MKKHSRSIVKVFSSVDGYSTPEPERPLTKAGCTTRNAMSIGNVVMIVAAKATFSVIVLPYPARPPEARGARDSVSTSTDGLLATTRGHRYMFQAVRTDMAVYAA